MILITKVLSDKVLSIVFSAKHKTIFLGLIQDRILTKNDKNYYEQSALKVNQFREIICRRLPLNKRQALPVVMSVDIALAIFRAADNILMYSKQFTMLESQLDASDWPVALEKAFVANFTIIRTYLGEFNNSIEEGRVDLNIGELLGGLATFSKQDILSLLILSMADSPFTQSGDCNIASYLKIVQIIVTELRKDYAPAPTLR